MICTSLLILFIVGIGVLIYKENIKQRGYDLEKQEILKELYERRKKIQEGVFDIQRILYELENETGNETALNNWKMLDEYYTAIQRRHAK